MKIKNNPKLIIILSIVVIISVVGGVFLFNKERKSADSVLEETQKTLDEMQGEESEISFDGSFSEGENIDITFRFRDYSNVPDDPETLAETEEALILVEGKAGFKIVEIGTIDKIDNFHQAGEGKELYYVVYEYKGNENNPDSVTIHPSSISETGWDPAPQFIIIDNGEDDYSSSYYSRSLLEFLGYDALLSGPDLNEEDVWVNVWEVDYSTIPQLALKYTDMSGDVHYIEVEE